MILHGQEGRDSLQIPVLEVENARSIPESKPTEKQWKEGFFFLRKKKRTEKRGTDQVSSKNSEEREKEYNRSKMSSSLQTAMKDVE